jgi:phosphatidylserine/phosphatidylglycerophosphate/cardiolipin synthase-like enzyme
MAIESTKFLKDSTEIRRAIIDLKHGNKLDPVVAFIGTDWQELLSRYKGNLRLICWLSSTNTNPWAVEQMISQGVEVRQRNSMHCKVYVAPMIGAVVGSANLSKAALAGGDIGGQAEAGISVVESSIVENIEYWFEALWHDAGTSNVKSADLRLLRMPTAERRKSEHRLVI